MSNIPTRRTWLSRITDNAAGVFCLLWLLAFIIYLPAAKAGMVGDFVEWMYHVRNTSFKDYINWNISGVSVLYQFTQVVTYVIHKVIGAYRWPWHIIELSMHVMNCTLLYMLVKRLLADNNIGRATMIAFSAAILFCVTPYASEVVVYEPCFHFSMSLIMMLCILLWVQGWLVSGRAAFIWLAAITYLLSTYTLELFYVTPFFTASLILFYQLSGKLKEGVSRKAILIFILPQLVFFGIHMLVYRKVYGNAPPHSLHLSKDLWNVYAAAPLKYLFHVLAMGRYMADDTRQAVYHFLEGKGIVIGFYVAWIAGCMALLLRFRRNGRGRAVALVMGWCLLSFVFVMPLWFCDTLLILFDRYIYLPAAMVYVLIAVFLSYIPSRYVANAIVAAFVVVNVWYSVETSLIWKQSADITNKLVRTFPHIDKKDRDKKVLLLNLPQCYKGALMIRAIGESEFKMMHNLFFPDSLITNPVYDVASYNMLEPQNGAHIMVVYDSVCHVTLNEFGNFWWYNDHGAKSYENVDYRLNMMDVGHWYELTLKIPSSEYILMYTVDDQWRVVDWNYKNLDQY